MLEREPPAAQPAGVDRARCHRSDLAGPPRQQNQGSRITGHVPGNDLPQDPRVRDRHPGQLTSWHPIENSRHPQLMRGKGHAPARPCLAALGYLEIIRNCGEPVTPSHQSLNWAITVSVSCQLVTGTHGTPMANTG